jgi:hypothetical protein
MKYGKYQNPTNHVTNRSSLFQANFKSDYPFRNVYNLLSIKLLIESHWLQIKMINDSDLDLVALENV